VPVRASPAQAGPRQLSGNTSASPRRIHQDAAEVKASRSSWTRLTGCQLEDPAVADYLAVSLGNEHLAKIISNVRRELPATVTGPDPKDPRGKLNRGRDIRPGDRLDLHRARHAIAWPRRRTTRTASWHLADYPPQPQCTVYGRNTNAEG
jgi:hypothetical protein